MKKTLLTLMVMMTTLISSIYAGGDIAPVEVSVAEPMVNSGDALSITSMLILMFLTTMTGLFFVKKESIKERVK